MLVCSLDILFIFHLEKWMRGLNLDSGDKAQVSAVPPVVSF